MLWKTSKQSFEKKGEYNKKVKESDRESLDLTRKEFVIVKKPDYRASGKR